MDVKNVNAKENFLHSIKGKVLFMGGISILASLILGYAGLHSLNKNSVNNEVLSTINTINLLQYENQSLDTSYLYFLEDSYLEQIVSNLGEMEEKAEEAGKLTSGSKKSDMGSVASGIAECKDNYEQIRSLSAERGFSEENGLYAQFAANDEQLSGNFQTVADDKSWIDGKWVEMAADGSTEQNGVTYSRMTYTGEIPDLGKRDFFLTRLGGNGIQYGGTIYIGNIVFHGASGTEEVDLGAMSAQDLGGSYGDALGALEIGEMDGKPAIRVTGNFQGLNDAWEEITVKIPAAANNIQNYDSVSFQIYLEGEIPSGMTSACAFSDKYNFGEKLADVNSLFFSYSRHVVEGADVTQETEEINALIEEMIANVSEYVSDETLKSTILTAMQEKQSLFKSMNESDMQILSMKKENIAISSALTEQTSRVREGIEKDTNAAKTSLTVVITVIFLISAAILLLITAAVSRSMNHSIRKFKDTLREVTEGNLAVRADDRGKDEFSVFGRSLNVFLARITEIIQSAQEISGKVSDSGDKLSGMAEDTSTTSDEIERAVGEIAIGATSQAQEITDASDSITNMAATFEKIVANVENLNSVTGEMRQIGQESTIFMQELTDSNEKTARAFEKVSEQIHITNESVNKIHEAADFITSIANQTNLLSLNASIEAARAGEAGRGFAVVATEIQKLSEQSNASASNIEQIIAELSKEANQTVDIIEDVTDIVKEQQEKLIHTKEKFVSLEGRVREAGKETDEIRKYTADCDAARKNVEAVFENLSAISEENAASSEETTASMTRLNETILQLADTSGELKNFANQLETDLKFFRLS